MKIRFHVSTRGVSYLMSLIMLWPCKACKPRYFYTQINHDLTHLHLLKKTRIHLICINPKSALDTNAKTLGINSVKADGSRDYIKIRVRLSYVLSRYFKNSMMDKMKCHRTFTILIDVRRSLSCISVKIYHVILVWTAMLGQF